MPRFSGSGDRLRATAESVARFLAPAPTGIRTAVVALRDTKYRLPTGDSTGLWGTWYLLPPATNGRVCLVFTIDPQLLQLASFLNASPPGETADVRQALLKVMGPCAFYTAFGTPGPRIEQWLRAQNYAVAGLADWAHPSPRLERPNPEDVTLSTGYPEGIPLTDLLIMASSGAFDMGIMRLPARACAHGRLAMCREILHGFVNPQPSLGLRYAIAPRRWWPGEIGVDFLSELVRREGRERFARFWSSDLSVDSAFTRAFSRPVEEWTQRWLLNYIRQPRFGPVIRISSVLVGLLLAAVGVAAAGSYSMRRQVS